MQRNAGSVYDSRCSLEFALHCPCVFSGMGPVHMNEVECSGFEKSLTDCYFNNDALGCSHEEDAGVRCNVPAMGFQKRVRTFNYWSAHIRNDGMKKKPL